jgi:cytochrome c553
MRAILGAVLVVVAVAAQAQGETMGDARRGKEKISMCVGCHGIPDYRTAYPEVYSVPMIAGQSPAYIMKALEEYKSGDRDHPTMRAIARSLSAQEMADLAAYFGTAAK